MPKESLTITDNRTGTQYELPIENYSDWQEIEITFDPIDKLPG